MYLINQLESKFKAWTMETVTWNLCNLFVTIRGIIRLGHFRRPCIGLWLRRIIRILLLQKKRKCQRALNMVSILILQNTKNQRQKVILTFLSLCIPLGLFILLDFKLYGCKKTVYFLKNKWYTVRKYYMLKSSNLYSLQYFSKNTCI